MRILVIDDMREFKTPPEGEVVYARTSALGKRILRSDKKWDKIYLDHDLGYIGRGGDADTVRPIISYIEEHSDEFAGIQFYVITSNGYAGDMMMRSLSTSGLIAFRLNPSNSFHYVW